MNRDEIIALAREAGFVVDETSRQHQPKCINFTHYLIDDELERFAALVAAAEREECAKVAMEPQFWRLPNFTHAPSDRVIGRIEGEKEMSRRITAAIRARGQS